MRIDQDAAEQRLQDHIKSTWKLGRRWGGGHRMSERVRGTEALKLNPVEICLRIGSRLTRNYETRVHILLTITNLCGVQVIVADPS